MSAKEIPRKFKEKNGDQVEQGMKDPRDSGFPKVSRNIRMK